MKDRPLACAHAFLTNISSVLPVSRSMDTGKETLRCTNELKVPDSDIDFWLTLINKIGSPRGIPRYLHKLLPESTQSCTEAPRKRLNAGALHFPGHFC